MVGEYPKTSEVQIMAAYMIFLILNGLLAAPVSSTSATTSRVSTTMVTAGVRTGPAAPVVTKTTQEGDETVVNVKSNTNVVLEKDGSISGTSSHSNVSVSGKWTLKKPCALAYRCSFRCWTERYQHDWRVHTDQEWLQLYGQYHRGQE